MTVKMAKPARLYEGPTVQTDESPTGYGAYLYDLNDPDDYKAWEAAWLERYPNGVAGGGADATPMPASVKRDPTDHADAYEGDPIAKARMAEALAYVTAYKARVDSGDILRPFGLILDIAADRRFGSKYMKLSERQVEVILNSKKRQLEWDAERLEAEKRRNEKLQSAPIVPKLPTGRRYYAVPGDSGKLAFLRITRTDEDMTFVDQLIGGGSEESGNGRTEARGRVLPNGQYIGTFEHLYRAVAADPETAMKRYGLGIGRCGYCGRDLTDEESRRLGIGPVCIKKGFGG